MTKFSTWRKIWSILNPQEKRQAVVILFVIIIASFFEAAMVGSISPFLMVLTDINNIEKTPILLWLFNVFKFESNYNFLVALGFFSLGIIILSNLILMLKTYIVVKFTVLRSHSFSLKLLSSYLFQPYDFFLSKHSGDMAKGILSEADQTVSNFFEPAANLIAAAFTVAFIASLLLYINPIVAVASCLILGGIYGGVYVFTSKFIKRAGLVRVASNGERFRVASEALGGIKDVKILGLEERYVKRFGVPSFSYARSHVAVKVISEFPLFIVQAAGFGGVVVLCLVLIDDAAIESGNALVGVLPLLGVFAFAGQRLLPALQQIYRGSTQIRYGAAAIDSLHEDISNSPILSKPSILTPEINGLHHELCLDSVTYSYPNSKSVGLQDVSVTIKKGEKIGIVGSTGAGKTTLVDIILGLLKTQIGSFKVDEIPISNSTYQSWQQCVGYVPQTIFLTDSSIAENIAFGVGAENVDQIQVERCAKLAQLHNFIVTELPDKYETAVGERGIRLSGGQKQRIGIARALYRDADLIVFDEATSALDNITERDLIESIDALPGDKTILIIAHRLSTVRSCDRILVLEKGSVVGFDTWSELLRTSVPFQKLAALPEKK